MSDFFDELNKSIKKGKESHLKYINYYKEQEKNENKVENNNESSNV